MTLGNAAIAALLSLTLSTGTGFAQPAPANPPGPSISPHTMDGSGKKVRRHARRAQITADVRAGRISRSEGKRLKQQLRAENAQRRAQKQARRNQGYQPANYPAPPASPPQR